MNGIRRSQRLPVYLAAGALFILVLVFYSGGHATTIAKSKSWLFSGEGSGSSGRKSGWFGLDEDLESLEEGASARKNPLALTTEETVIPSTPIPSNPTTQQKAHVHGFTVFDKLYLRGGTLYVVTSDPDFPPRNLLLAKPLPLTNEDQSGFVATDEVRSGAVLKPNGRLIL